MEKRFPYRFDKRSRRITAAVIAVVVLVFVALVVFGRGTYLLVWFLSVGVPVLALYLLSIPRFVALNDRSLDIHCLLELTHIPIEEITRIRKIDRSAAKYLVPLLGSYGFLGYYGYYLHLTQWEMVKVYASEWQNFVEIEDIYEQKYLISCREADELIAAVLDANRHFLDNRPPAGDSAP